MTLLVRVKASERESKERPLPAEPYESTDIFGCEKQEKEERGLEKDASIPSARRTERPFPSRSPSFSTCSVILSFPRFCPRLRTFLGGVLSTALSSVSRRVSEKNSVQ